MTDQKLVKKPPLVIVDKREKVSYNAEKKSFVVETTSGGVYITRSKIKIPNFGKVYYTLDEFSESCIIKDF